MCNGALRATASFGGPEDRLGRRVGSVVANGDLFGHAPILRRAVTSASGLPSLHRATTSSDTWSFVAARVASAGSEPGRTMWGRMARMEEVEVKAVPLELLASILTPDRARAPVRGRGAGAGGLRGPHDLACERDGPRWRRRRDAPDPAGVRARGGDREPLARARWRAGVLRRHEAPAQPLARRPGRWRCRSAPPSTPATNGSSPRTSPRCSPWSVARDIVLLHDPQTAGMVDGLRATGVRVVWRCHVGRDTSNDETDEAWAFLRPYVEGADAFVFSRAEYVPEWMDRERVVVIPPSIDPFSAKNRELDPTTVRAILATVGLLAGAATRRPDLLPTPRRLARARSGTTPASSPTERRRPTRRGSSSRSAAGIGSRTWPACSPASPGWPPTVPPTPTSCWPARTCPG